MLQKLQEARKAALKEYYVRLAYFNAETQDERLKSILANDAKEALIEYRYCNWLILRYLNTIK